MDLLSSLILKIQKKQIMNKNIKIFLWVLISLVLLNSNRKFLTSYEFTVVMAIILISIVGTLIFSTYKNLNEGGKSKFK